MVKPKKSVELMQAYNPPLEGRRDFLKLDFNENTVGPTKAVITAIKEVSQNELSCYPEYGKFRRKLAAYLKVNESELVITNASDEAIKLIIDTYMEKEDDIIIPVPTYPMFRFYAEVLGARIKEVLFNKDLSFPTEKILKSITNRTKIIVIVSPNSPTGTSVEDKDIIKIIKKAKNSMVLLDEAYFQYSGKSLKNLISKYDNLAITQTFSKAFGLAGLRLGYIISNKENIKYLRKANSPYSANILAIIAAKKAIENDKYVSEYVNQVKDSGAILKKELKKLKLKFYDSKANFILVDFGKNSRHVESELKKKGILVRDQSEKPLLKGCIRITLGTRQQTKKLISALKEALN